MAKELTIQELETCIDQRLNAFAQKMYADIQQYLDGVLADRLDNDSLPEPTLNESVVSQDHSKLDSRDRLLLAGLGQQQKELLEFSRNIMAALGSLETGLKLTYEKTRSIDSTIANTYHAVDSLRNDYAYDQKVKTDTSLNMRQAEDYWATSTRFSKPEKAYQEQFSKLEEAETVKALAYEKQFFAEQNLVLPEQSVTSIEEQPVPPSTYAWRNGPDPSQYRTGFPDGKGSFN